jgi:hypothetical protein
VAQNLPARGRKTDKNKEIALLKKAKKLTPKADKMF